MESEDECIISENDQDKERLSSSMINYISVQSLKQNPEINQILQKHLFPTKKINDQIGNNCSKIILTGIGPNNDLRISEHKWPWDNKPT